MVQSTTTKWRADWAIEFCSSYSSSLFAIGKWTVILAILLGVALAAANVIATFKTVPAFAEEKGAVPSPSFVEALKGFIQAIASAPTWLALFGGGIFLLWMAGNAVPEQCEREVRPASARSELANAARL